jgi:hypothetical protein
MAILATQPKEILDEKNWNIPLGSSVIAVLGMVILTTQPKENKRNNGQKNWNMRLNRQLGNYCAGNGYFHNTTKRKQKK